MFTRSFNSQILMDTTDMLHPDGLNVRYRAPPISVYEAVIGHILSNRHLLHLFLHIYSINIFTIHPFGVGRPKLLPGDVVMKRR